MSPRADFVILLCAYLVTLTIGWLVGGAMPLVALDLCSEGQCGRGFWFPILVAGLGAFCLAAPAVWALRKTFGGLGKGS